MSLKAKLKPYIFALGLVFSLFFYFNNAFAFVSSSDSSPTLNLDYFSYTDGKLTIQIDNNNTTYGTYLMASTNVGYSGRYLNNNDTSFKIFSFYCPDLTPTTMTGGMFAGLQVYLIPKETINVKCYVKKIQFDNYACGVSNSTIITNNTGITKTEMDNASCSNVLESRMKIDNTGSTFYFQPALYLVPNGSTNFGPAQLITGINKILSSSINLEYFPLVSVIEGVCGTAQGQTLTTIPPENSYACSSGTMVNFSAGYTNELEVELRYDWLCEGSGGGSSSACYSAIIQSPINGVCGTANGNEFSVIPLEYERCSTGSSQGSLLETLGGWTWSCYGFNNGTTASCSAIYTDITTPPVIPDTSIIPTPTDCDTYSGIDKVLCNFGNTIQGMFLPSTEKITELQNTLNLIGNVFPFNYLRAIGSVFTNANITNGTLTMTLLGTTGTLSPDFFDMPIFSKVRLFFTIMVLLMFTFWAINYIKHFFK